VWTIVLLISILAALGAGVTVGLITRSTAIGKRLNAAELKSGQVLQEAEQQKAGLILEAKEEGLRIRTAGETDLRERRNEIQKQERRIISREENVERRSSVLERQEEEVTSRDLALKLTETELEQLKEEQTRQLELVASLTVNEAKELVQKRAEDEARHDLSRRYWEIEQQYKADSEEKAREYVTHAVERLAADVVAETTVSSVPLPNDEMKGRLIGREGRNIRAIEQATGVDLIIDDTPEAVTLSCFDPIRREVARITIEKLIVDGRIHPSRVEEMADKARAEVDKTIKEAGEQAVFEAGVRGMSPEAIKLLGRLRFRTSYGSNVLKESVLAANVAGMIAAEIGANVEVSKMGALCHDIGKALTHEIEGPHADIGADIAIKYGIPGPVAIAIQEHHDDDKSSIEAFIVSAADAITSSRPGARRDTVENYIKRLENLEAVAKSFPGIEKTYAIQAGREVRIMVKPDQINDIDAANLANDVVKKIQESLVYPGQIKVVVVRETRNVQFAK
jgi:ribonuclease Y